MERNERQECRIRKQVGHIPGVVAADQGASEGACQSLEGVVCWWVLGILAEEAWTPPTMHDMSELAVCKGLQAVQCLRLQSHTEAVFFTSGHQKYG